MASRNGAALTVALLIAVWVMLLHSSTAQQPPAQQPPAQQPPAPAPSPAFDCSSCSSSCTQTCQGMADGRASYCKSTYDPAVVYKGCLEDCANNTCNGNYSHGALGCCAIGTCTPNHCGRPCVQDCCKSCTSQAYGEYHNCLGSQSGSGRQSCVDGCTYGCKAHYGCS